MHEPLETRLPEHRHRLGHRNNGKAKASLPKMLGNHRWEQQTMDIAMFATKYLDLVAYVLLLPFVNCKPYTALTFGVKRGFLA
jgi:hypothetical protein